MEDLKVLIDHAAGLHHMQRDLDLFSKCESGENNSTLVVYSWTKPCISLGYSQNIDEEISLAKANEMGFDVVKRPTGGGIVFHNEAEATYSLITQLDNKILPKGLVPSYKKISQAVVDALMRLGVSAEIARTQKVESRTQNTGLCFSYPAEYEVVVDGKKIVGSAQKRGKKALLQQGSIFVRNTPDECFSVLKKPHESVNAISVEEVLKREVGFAEISDNLVAGFEKLFKN